MAAPMRPYKVLEEESLGDLVRRLMEAAPSPERGGQAAFSHLDAVTVYRPVHEADEGRNTDHAYQLASGELTPGEHTLVAVPSKNFQPDRVRAWDDRKLEIIGPSE